MGLLDRVKALANKIDRDKQSPGLQLTKPKFYSPVPGRQPEPRPDFFKRPAVKATFNTVRSFAPGGNVVPTKFFKPAAKIGMAGFPQARKEIGEAVTGIKNINRKQGTLTDVYNIGQVGMAPFTSVPQYLLGGTISTGMQGVSNLRQGQDFFKDYEKSFTQGMSKAPVYAGLSKLSATAGFKVPAKLKGKPMEKILKAAGIGAAREAYEGFIEGVSRPLEEGETRGGALFNDMVFGALFGSVMEGGGQSFKQLKKSDQEAVKELMPFLKKEGDKVAVNYHNIRNKAGQFAKKYGLDDKKLVQQMEFLARKANEPVKVSRFVNGKRVVEEMPRWKAKLEDQPFGLSTKNIREGIIEEPNLKTQPDTMGKLNQDQLMLPARSATPPDVTLRASLEEAKPQRALQEKLYTQERSKRLAKFQQTTGGGEMGARARLKTLGGELPKAEFEPIKQKFTQQDIDDLYNMIDKAAAQNPDLGGFERATAYNAIDKMMGEQGTALPTNSELKILKQVFGDDFVKSVKSKDVNGSKISRAIADVLAVPRSIMAGGFDMSYGLRQGVFGAYKYPKQWAKSFGDQFKWFASEDALKQSMDNIKADPTYKAAKQSGLSMTEMDDLSLREEQYFSGLAEKIPGLGKLIRASGRAYTGFANQYRFDIFKDMVKNGKLTGAIDDPEYLKSAARYINTATGRGDFTDIYKPLNQAIQPMSQALFSPRLLASRLNNFNPVYYTRLQPEVRKEALKSLAGFVGGTATILALADTIPGVEVGKDPRSSDFGKIKIGNSRIDIMGGQQQLIVAAARLIANEMVSSNSGNIITLGEGYKPTTRMDVISRFIESKQAPVLSFFTSMMKGENAIGEDFKLGPEVLKRMTPMLAQDLYDLYQDSGFRQIAMSIPAFFGAGVQTYGGVPKVESREDFMGLSTNDLYRYLKDVREKDPNKYAELRAYLKQESPNKYANVREQARLEQLGATPREIAIKGFTVADGTRAEAIAKQFKKLDTKEEKQELWKRYVELKIITKDVSKQLKQMLSEGKF